MAVVNGYATVAEVRSQFGDAGSKLDAGLLEKAINTASRGVDKHCNRRFWQDAAVTTRLFRVDAPGIAWTDDISTTTGLLVKTDQGGDGVFETTWTAGTDYQLEPLNGEIVASGDTGTPYAWWRIVAVGAKTFPLWDGVRATLQVTARFGWSAIPDEVNQATILRAVALFRRKDAPFGVAGFGDFGVHRITRVDPDVADLLAPYVKQRPRTLTYGAQRRSLFHTTGWV
jgi:hypothetical protein